MHASQVLRKPVVYEPTDLTVYRASGAPGAADMANMFQFYQDFEARRACPPLRAATQMLPCAHCTRDCSHVFALSAMSRITARTQGHFVASRNVDYSRKLNPHLQSFQQWLAAHADAFKDL